MIILNPKRIMPVFPEGSWGNYVLWDSKRTLGLPMDSSRRTRHTTHIRDVYGPFLEGQRLLLPSAPFNGELYCGRPRAFITLSIVRILSDNLNIENRLV